MPDRTISILRREAALRALGIDAVDLVQVTIDPKQVTVWSVIRDDHGRVKLTALGTPELVSETMPFYTP